MQLVSGGNRGTHASFELGLSFRLNALRTYTSTVCICNVPKRWCCGLESACRWIAEFAANCTDLLLQPVLAQTLFDASVRHIGT